MWLRYNENNESLGARLINTNNINSIYRYHAEVIGVNNKDNSITKIITCSTTDEAEYVLQAIYAGIENGRKTLDINETVKRFREKKG